jgi:hypothetical protein
MSSFEEIFAQVAEVLRQEERISYRALKRRFQLDDEYIEDLKTELIDAKRLAQDEDGKVLVWAGEDRLESRVPSLKSKTAKTCTGLMVRRKGS